MGIYGPGMLENDTALEHANEMLTILKLRRGSVAHVVAEIQWACGQDDPEVSALGVALGVTAFLGAYNMEWFGNSGTYNSYIELIDICQNTFEKLDSDQKNVLWGAISTAIDHTLYSNKDWLNWNNGYRKEAFRSIMEAFDRREVKSDLHIG